MAKTFTYNLLEDGGKSIIVFEGNLTLKNINKIKNKLAEAVHKSNNIEIVAGNVDNLDISFIQLLFAAFKTAQIESKVITFKLSLTDELRILVERAGFTSLLYNNVQIVS